MNAIHNARDLLNGSHANPKSSSATSWLGTLNGAAGAAARSTPFDLNTAGSAASDAVKGSFRAAMDRITTSPAKDATPPTEEDAKLRKTAEMLVNKMFVGTMLKGMRSSPFKDPTMSGGKAGEAYAGLFDQNLAEHAGGGIGTRLVDVLVKSLKTHHADPKQLHVDPKRDVKKNASHDAVTVNLAA